MDIGAELRAAREAKGLTLGALAQRTRVQPRSLAAIEANDLAAIPPRPFGRGFVRAYAAEVDLDPERTVQNYFAQFPPAPVPVHHDRVRPSLASGFDPSSQWAGLGTAAAIVAALLVVAIMTGRGGERAVNGTPGDRPRAARDAIGTSGTTARSTSSSPAGGAAAAPTQTSPPLRLAVAVSRPCWIAATTDGQRAIYRIVQSGEKLTLDARQEIAIRFGDAGAVEWTINGRKGAPLGGAGAVRNLTCRMPAGDCTF